MDNERLMVLLWNAICGLEEYTEIDLLDYLGMTKEEYNIVMGVEE